MRLAQDNDGWGYTKIPDVMRRLGHDIGRTKVKRILAEDGINPAPERLKNMPWEMFLKAHWGAIAAVDFFQVEVHADGSHHEGYRVDEGIGRELRPLSWQRSGRGTSWHRGTMACARDGGRSAGKTAKRAAV